VELRGGGVRESGKRGDKTNPGQKEVQGLRSVFSRHGEKNPDFFHDGSKKKGTSEELHNGFLVVSSFGN